MMKVIIDSNVAFSAILNANSPIGQILFNGGRHFDFYAPEYVRTELLKHQDKIKEIAHLSDGAFLEVYELILRQMVIIHHSIVPLQIYERADELCRFIDPDDTAFVALTIYLNGKLCDRRQKANSWLIKTRIHTLHQH